MRAPGAWNGGNGVLRVVSPTAHLASWVNGERVRFRDEIADALYVEGFISLAAGEANALVIRVDELAPDATFGPITIDFVPKHRNERIDVLLLSGTWQFRIGDDPSYATLPLPSKFAASTDVVFDLADALSGDRQ